MHGFYAVDGPASRRAFDLDIVFLGASRWPPQIVIRYVPHVFWNRIGNPDGHPGMPRPDQLKGRPIGRVLTKMGKVTREQVIAALVHQRDHGGLLGEIMVKLGFIQPADIPAALTGQRGERYEPPAG